MSPETPSRTPEKKEILDDNARKFVTTPLDPRMLAEHQVTSFVMTTDWLETGADNEKKLAHKAFDNGDLQILLIEKVTKDGNRTSMKQPLTADAYGELLDASLLHLKKKRHEFTYLQHGTPFSIKYDEFADSTLCIVEVDAATEAERNRFDPSEFPSDLVEVTGDARYYGYRVATLLGTA